MSNFFQIKTFLLSIILLVSGSSGLWAESVIFLDEVDDYVPELSEIKGYENIKKATADLSDSVIYYTRGANGLIIMPPEDWDPFPYNVRFRDTVIYNPAYLPVVFDGKILPPDLDFLPKDKKATGKQFHLIPEDETLAPLIERANNTQKLRRSFYMNMNNIHNVRYNAATLKTIPKFNEEEATKRNAWNELITAEDPIRVTPVALPKIDPEYIYWIRGGEHRLQLTQNFASLNWHKGENRSFLLLNNHKVYLNYKKGKVTFDNSLEWRLNLQQTPADTAHSINISDDLVRLENRFGYTAFNKWSYSAKLETQTQLFSSYPINEKNKKNTSLLSPLVVNFGIGMNYALEKKYKSDKAKLFKFSLNLAPLSFNYVYLNELSVSQKSGVKDGSRDDLQFGSTINSDLSFKFSRYMSWTSRFKYFTDYDYSQMEFENKFDMTLNRYLATTVYLYLRFDDNGTKAKKPLNYFQLNEMLSFGLSYKW